MQFNGDLKNRVIAKFNSAIKQINNCKAVHIDIPADFEGAGDIRSALDKIKSAHLEFIKSEFEKAVNDAENADRKTMENVRAFEFENNNKSSDNLLWKIKNGNKVNIYIGNTHYDNHDGYHQIKEEKSNSVDSSIKIIREINRNANNIKVNYVRENNFLKNLENINSIFENKLVTTIKSELKKNLNIQNMGMNNEVMDEVISQIDSITIENITKSGLLVGEYTDQYNRAIENVFKYVNEQERGILEQGRQITQKERKIETKNTKEYLEKIRDASTHVKKDGKVYINIDGKLTMLTSEIFLKSVKETQEYIYEHSSSHNGNFRYGNSGTPMPGQLQDTDSNRKPRA